VKRRMFLKGAGVVTVIAMGGGVWRAYDQGVFGAGTGPAYEAWKDWRKATSDGPLELVRAAILAASPHNTQPWLFKVTRSSIELYLDTQRNVGALDPYLREEHLGMGCALENLMLAASANGYAATAVLLPGKLSPSPTGPKTKLVARVDLSTGKREDGELYNVIPRRHTNRSPYDPHRPVPPDFLAALSRLPGDSADVRFFLFTDRADRERAVELSSAANTEIYSDPDVHKSSERWVRTEWSSMQKFRDGLSIDAFGQPIIVATAAKIMPERMFQWVASHSVKHAYSDLMLSAPLIGYIAVRDRYDQEQCLEAGRIWQRAHLFATASGLAARPCNESVEIVDHENALGKPASYAAQLSRITRDPSWQPTFVVYMGYPTLTANASPRRPLQAVLV
jgi:nitroreductase